MNTLWENIRRRIRYYSYINGHIDTDDAAQRIRSGIWFRGPNVWILAFSIVIASVGLNVNSTAVIIGAMLISPLMGPIIGTGLALGTNDFDLLRDSGRNLLVMVVISLIASTLFFLLSPLTLVNPTELEARTSPTIYDVLIAFFGGLAGILENSRKERGTVLSGVAIATALMPPLCTAGYGLAHMNMHFFLGAMYLFIINGVFITLATYIMVKYLRFKTVGGIDAVTARRRRNAIYVILAVVMLPSLVSAFFLIRDNNFERHVQEFVSQNKMVGRSYIYDYTIFNDHGKKVEISIAGEPLTPAQQQKLLDAAAKARVKPSQVILRQHTLGMTSEEMNRLIQDIYKRTDDELSRKDAQLQSLKASLDSLSNLVEALIVVPEPPVETEEENNF